MRHGNLAVLTSLAFGLALVACERPQEDRDDGEILFTGEHPSCDREPDAKPTGPIHTITVEEGEVSVRPHPLVQPPGPIGFIGWKSRTHHWRVSYPDGSPLPKDVYEGRPHELVLDGVKGDAECRGYAYVVEAWLDPVEAETRQGRTDTVRQAYPPEVARDTLNGDEIEPYVIRR